MEEEKDKEKQDREDEDFEDEDFDSGKKEEKNNHHDEKKDHHEKHEVKIDNDPDNKVKKFKNSIGSNPWQTSTLILGVIAIVLLIMYCTGGASGISGESAGEKVVSYLNSRTGGGVEYISHEDLGDIYEVTVKFQDQNLPVFISKDGDYFIQGAVPMTPSTSTPTTPDQQPPQDVVKSDKPEVELFVMTHCLYGTQAEKGMLPVYSLLGDKIDSSIKFVHYFLHKNPGQEPDETPIQICIREEQPTKFTDYLTCFLEDGDSDRCLEETNIDENKLDTCIETKSDDYYDTDSTLSEGYGVRGSPSLVINGQMVNSGRSPSAYLETICSAFNTPPEECEEVLSTANPSAGFGYTAQAGGSTNAQC